MKYIQISGVDQTKRATEKTVLMNVIGNAAVKGVTYAQMRTAHNTLDKVEKLPECGGLLELEDAEHAFLKRAYEGAVFNMITDVIADLGDKVVDAQSSPPKGSKH